MATTLQAVFTTQAELLLKPNIRFHQLGSAGWDRYQGNGLETKPDFIMANGSGTMAISVAEQNDFSDMELVAHGLLAEVLKSLGRYEEALLHREASARIHEQIFNRDTDLRIMVPTDKADQVGLRPVAGSEDVDEVLQILRETAVRFDRNTWNRRYRGFMEKIKTGSLFEVAEVFRDLYRLKETKTLSFGERRMLDTAKNLIVKELSVAKNITEVKVEKELERIFSC